MSVQKGAETFEDVSLRVRKDRFDEIRPRIANFDSDIFILFISYNISVRKRTRIDDEFRNRETAGHNHFRIDSRTAAEDVDDEYEGDEVLEDFSTIFAGWYGGVREC